MKKLFPGLLTGLSTGLFIWGLLVNGHLAVALSPKAATDPLKHIMVPHRAVYELSLVKKHQSISVSAITGRMVFELTGSPCTGYRQKMRMVTRIIDAKGQPTLLDDRSNSWEGSQNRKFQFVLEQYKNKELQEHVTGSARRDQIKSKLDVQVKEPEALNLELPGDVLFPVQHSLALQRAARAGRNHLDVRVYDGSDQGRSFYKTYSFIGGKKPPVGLTGGANNKTGRGPHDENLTKLGLSDLSSWPVAVSYFYIARKYDDKIPVYELSFRMFENGVSSSMLMNYGHFSVYGRLGQVKYLRTKPCKRK